MHEHLEWPFFDDRHRAWAGRLHAETALRSEASRDESDPATACHAWVSALARDGILGACIPAADGGVRDAIDVRTLCLTREALAYADGLADFAFAMQGLGAAPIALFGAAPLRERYLPAIAHGACISAFALSESEAGSDVAAIETRARRIDGGYRIDGEKTWISNAGIADAYVLFARTSDDGRRGLTALVVDARAPGISVSGLETISPHPLGTVTFDGVEVSESQRLGDEGRGFAVAMATLELFRPTVGAAALGFARRAFDETRAHVKRRKLFGGPLADLQLTQAAIAAMATDIDAAALLVYRAAWTKDVRGGRTGREASMAKWFATEAAGRICDRAVQLFGGRGVTRGEIVERLYRDVRALRIYEGASEIQQLIVAKHALEEHGAGT